MFKNAAQAGGLGRNAKRRFVRSKTELKPVFVLLIP